MLRFAILTAATVFTATAVVGCTGSDKPEKGPVGAHGATRTEEKAAVPAYKVSPGGQPNLLIASVDTGYEHDQFESIVADIAGQHTGDSGDFTVAFTCTQPTEGLDPRLAYGAFTAGQMKGKVRVVYKATCPAPAPPHQPTTPGGLTAAKVLDAIVVAVGLPAENPADHTQGMCQQIGCVQSLQGDGVEIDQFPNETEVADAARMWTPEERHVKGDILMRFRFGGSTGITPQRADQYRAVLDGLAG